MDTLVALLKSHPGPSVLVFSLIFRLIHRLLQRLPVPKVVLQDDTHAWKWRNLSVSMVHSLLTGTWALTCAAVWPETLTNLHYFNTPQSYLLVCVSTGYFVQDAADIIFAGRARAPWGLLVHHVLVISTFLYTLYTELYIAGAVVALFVEVNSVTLHLRMLLKLADRDHASSTYYINKHVNVFTYVVFRLGTQFYLTWYTGYNYARLEHSIYFLIALIMMNIMMLVYFYRLVRSDFFPRSDKSVGQNGTCNNNSKKIPSD